MRSARTGWAKVETLVATILGLKNRFERLDHQLEQLKINQGLILTALNRQKNSKDLKDYEFKVFSQSGEDGIIQHLVEVVDIRNRTFIEFGVEDFSESNCRYLLIKDNWHGFVIDGSRKHVERIRRSYFFWKYHLQAHCAFITRDNINELLRHSGFQEDLGILSVDIDGNDYYVLEAIDQFRPRILICEYNAIFGPDRKISVPYDPVFHRTTKHWSNLYFGCSLAAIAYVADKKGYSLVGVNSTGSNAFFVRKDLLNEHLQVLTARQAFVESNFRESRDEQGQLTYLTGRERLEVIKGLPVLNVETGAMETL